MLKRSQPGLTMAKARKQIRSSMFPVFSDNSRSETTNDYGVEENPTPSGTLSVDSSTATNIMAEGYLERINPGHKATIIQDAQKELFTLYWLPWSLENDGSAIAKFGTSLAPNHTDIRYLESGMKVYLPVAGTETLNTNRDLSAYNGVQVEEFEILSAPINNLGNVICYEAIVAKVEGIARRTISVT